MSELLKYRLAAHLTQDELGERSGISVRTIQRIEAGTPPKGYTLKALAKALEVEPADLLGTTVPEDPAQALNKLINLSGLPFVLLPPLNIAVPLLLMYRRQAVNETTQKIVSLQILWTVAAVVLFLLSAFCNRIFAADFPFPVVTGALLVLADGYLIIRNAVALSRTGQLRIGLKFNLL